MRSAVVAVTIPGAPDESDWVLKPLTVERLVNAPVLGVVAPIDP
jgi:hypothetical protein